MTCLICGFSLYHVWQLNLRFIKIKLKDVFIGFQELDIGRHRKKPNVEVRISFLCLRLKLLKQQHECEERVVVLALYISNKSLRI